MGFFGHFSNNRPTAFGAWITTKSVIRQFAFVAPFLPEDHGISILEIGPGRGEFAQIFLTAGYLNYSIVEPDSGLRAICERLPIRTSYSAIIPPLPVANASQDLIIMCDVFEHMNDASVAAAVIAEVKRSLKPGGLIFILCPDYMDWKEEFFNCDYSHSNPTTVRRTSQLFHNNGLQTLVFSYQNAFLSGFLGSAFGLVVKLVTYPFRFAGARNESRIYRLRLCFLRRFLILGRAVAD